MSIKEIFINSCEILNNIEEIYNHVLQLKIHFDIFESKSNEDYTKIKNDAKSYKTYISFKKSILQFDHDYLYGNENYMGHDNVFQYHDIHKKLYLLCKSLKIK